MLSLRTWIYYLLVDNILLSTIQLFYGFVILAVHIKRVLYKSSYGNMSLQSPSCRGFIIKLGNIFGARGEWWSVLCLNTVDCPIIIGGSILSSTLIRLLFTGAYMCFSVTFLTSPCSFLKDFRVVCHSFLPRTESDWTNYHLRNTTLTEISFLKNNC